MQINKISNQSLFEDYFEVMNRFNSKKSAITKSAGFVGNVSEGLKKMFGFVDETTTGAKGVVSDVASAQIKAADERVVDAYQAHFELKGGGATKISRIQSKIREAVEAAGGIEKVTADNLEATIKSELKKIHSSRYADGSTDLLNADTGMVYQAVVLGRADAFRPPSAEAAASARKALQEAAGEPVVPAAAKPAAAEAAPTATSGVKKPRGKKAATPKEKAEELVDSATDVQKQADLVEKLRQFNQDMMDYDEFHRQLRQSLGRKSQELSEFARANPANPEAQAAAKRALVLYDNAQKTEKLLMQTVRGQQNVTSEVYALVGKKEVLDPNIDVPKIDEINDQIRSKTDDIIEGQVTIDDSVVKTVEDLKSVDPKEAEKIIESAPEQVRQTLSQRLMSFVSSIGESISSGFSSLKKRVSDMISSGKKGEEVAVEIAKAPDADAAKVIADADDVEKTVIVKSFKEAEASGKVSKGTFLKYLKYLAGAGLISGAAYGAYRVYAASEGFDMTGIFPPGETPGTAGQGEFPGFVPGQAGGAGTGTADSSSLERQAIAAAKAGDSERVLSILNQLSSTPDFTRASGNIAAFGYGKKYIIMFTPPLTIPTLGTFGFVAVNDSDATNPGVVNMSRAAAEGVEVGQALAMDVSSRGTVGSNPQRIANEVFETILNQRLGRRDGQRITRRIVREQRVAPGLAGGREGQRRTRGLTPAERRQSAEMAGIGRGPLSPRASEDSSRLDKLKKFAEISNENYDYSEIEDKKASISTNKKKSVDLSQFFKIADDFSKTYHKDAVSDLNDKDPFMSSYFTGLSGLYDEKPKPPEGDYASLYNLHDETGDDLIHAAHPKEVRLLHAIKDGGLVENGFEQQRASKAIAQGMPTGNYTGNYAWVKNVVKNKK